MRPFSMRDKLGYTLGDLGCCCTEQFRAMYLSVFYTLILQVNPFHIGILMLITKIWDAVNDPIIGAIVDSRKGDKGRKVHSVDTGLFVSHGGAVHPGLCQCEQFGLWTAPCLHVCYLCSV